MSRNVLVGSVVVLGVLAVSIGFVTLRSRSIGESPPSGAAPVPTASAPSSLRLVPDIEVVMYQGQAVVGGDKVALSQLWERRPVILNFWAGLCPPCRAEMPDFQRLYNTEQARKRFVLIGVDIGPFIGLGSRDDARALLRELKISFPTGTTFDARTVRNYEILGMPTTVFITTDGRLLRKHTGLLTFEQMRAFAEELVKVSAR
ncbi:MAG: TlpA family protein disulfide reductase [bacterium]